MQRRTRESEAKEKKEKMAVSEVRGEETGALIKLQPLILVGP